MRAEYINCKMYPDISTPSGVEESRLYKDLISKKGEKLDRPIANLLYASYLCSDIEQKMEEAVKPDGSKKYFKNRQGQFNAKDLVDFLDFNAVIEEMNSLAEKEYKWGFTDALGGKRVDYTNAEEALKKADEFNNTYKGLVSSVIKHSTPSGTIYNIVAYERNTTTVDYPVAVRETLACWEVYKQVFNEKGIDITNMPEEFSNIFSAYNIDLAKSLKNLTLMELSNFYKNDALLLFTLDKGSRDSDNLISKFGSLENAAQALNDYNHGYISLTPDQKVIIKRALKHAQSLNGIDINALVKQIEETSQHIKDASPEIPIKKEVHKLRGKYKAFRENIERVSSDIKTLSDATSEMMITLNRKIREINKQMGKNEEGRKLEVLRDKLEREYNTRKYYSGVLNFLSIASEGIKSMDDLLSLKEVPQTGTEIEKIFATVKTLRKIKDIKDQYSDIVAALADETTVIDESINQIDIDNLRITATELNKILKSHEEMIKKLSKRTAKDFMKEMTMGKVSTMEINNAIEMAAKDASWADQWLYSMGRASNLLISTTGTLIQNAQRDATQTMNIIAKDIARADDKLRKAGHDSKFIYEDQRHIISDIDWGKYETARNAKIKELKKLKLSDFSYKQELEDWEEQNTEERVVDKVSGRKERVPDSKFRKTEDFQKDWDDAMKEYYNTMMQLKGQLDSLLPYSAQHHYLPPQVRRDTLDALANATEGEANNLIGVVKNTAKNVAKAAKNKAKDFWTVREDDTDYAENGTIRGEETLFAEGNYDNTIKREIPIYYQNNVEDGELLLDFSSGLTKYAKSAISYSAMDKVKETCEFMRDFAEQQNPAAVFRGKNVSEAVDSKQMLVVKSLYKWGKRTNVSSIMTGFIDQYIYGIKKNQNHPHLSKIFDSIIAYTSFKGLATNVPGAVANALMGINQIYIDAGSSEFFSFKDLGWAATKLFGDAGIKGEMMDFLSNNKSSKASLFKEIFDPMQENFSDKGNKRYYNNMFMQFLSKDFSFMGYGSGEYIIHMLPMYAILHKQKVLLDGKETSLYDAFEITSKTDGNAELIMKKGVTDLEGNPITKEYLDKVRGHIRYANQSMHGAMNAEDKGLIHQYIIGRATMNFRQWAVEHYSRRFRGRHFDYSIGDFREGYWVSLWKGLMNDDTKETWKYVSKTDAVWMFMKDFMTFMFRAQTQWKNLDDMQRANIKRVRAEILMYISLLGLSFALGEPDEHKKEFWRRWWMYQTKRMITETEATLPGLHMIDSSLKMINAPMAGLNTMNSFMYLIYGLTNGDLWTEIQRGPHKGEYKYWRNVKKYTLPFFKDYERLKTLDEDDALFKIFEQSPNNH